MAVDRVWVVRDADAQGAIVRVGYSAFEVIPDLFDSLMSTEERKAWRALERWIENAADTERTYRSDRFTMRQEPLLPLDPAAIPERVVERVVDAMVEAEDEHVAQSGIDGAGGNTIEDRMKAILRAALAAAAQALGEDNPNG